MIQLVWETYLYLESIGEIIHPFDSIWLWLKLEAPNGGRMSLDRLRKLRGDGKSFSSWCWGTSSSLYWLFWPPLFMLEANWTLIGPKFISIFHKTKHKKIIILVYEWILETQFQRQKTKMKKRKEGNKSFVDDCIIVCGRLGCGPPK